MLEKPSSVENDPYKSAKWDEITASRRFKESDAPMLALLCQWYSIAQRCMDDIDEVGGQVAYTNDLGDLKAQQAARHRGLYRGGGRGRR